MCPTRDKSQVHRIGYIGKDDRQRAGQPFGCECGPGPRSHEHLHRETDELGGQAGEQLEFAPPRAVLDNEVLALDIAPIAQALLESLDAAGASEVSWP